MGSKDKALNLLKRFPFTDLAVAVARKGALREKFLRGFVESGGIARSYRWTRGATGLIYCVELPMFPAPVLSWREVEKAIRDVANDYNVESNVEAGQALFDLVRPKKYKAYSHDEQVLRVGLKQIVSVGLNFYIVDGDRLVFQFPQPRAQCVFDDHVAITMMSVMHHAYAVGDFADADVEIADVSCEEEKGPRMPRIRKLEQEDLMSLEELNKEIVDVYEILRGLAARKFDSGPGDLGV